MALLSIKRSATALAFFICSGTAFAAGWGALGGEEAQISEPATASQPVASQGQTRAQAAPVQAQSVSSTTFARAQATLLAQIEQMQQEMLMLRGTLEEQAHKIRMLEKTAETRYLDLDSRVSQLVTGSGAALAGSSAISGSAATSPAAVAAESDAGAYKAAFALVRAQDYDKAAPAFVAFQGQYPQSPLIANSWYWLGEVYLIQEQLEPARQAFTQVVDLFSGHRKEPDARYKLAVVYDRLGNKEKARVILNQLIEAFSDSNPRVVKLAQEYLQTI